MERVKIEVNEEIGEVDAEIEQINRNHWYGKVATSINDVYINVDTDSHSKESIKTALAGHVRQKYKKKKGEL